MSVLVTGVAGFIGAGVAGALLAQGAVVVGVDNFSDQYDPVLKFARLKPLRENKGFSFLEADVADRETMQGLAQKHGDLDRIVHLAAHSGVRQSMVDPYIYGQTNVMGHLVLLELARGLKDLKHFVYASASSVYGANRKLPFVVGDPVDHPVSLYAATKRADELMTETYTHLYGLKATGLRYFTTYGPWGRPDMSPYVFAKAIHEGRTIELNHLGFLKRDYSYIDDMVTGTLAVLDKPPGDAAHRIYNLGAARSEDIVHVISLFETAFAKKAIVELKPGEPGTLQETAADITDTTRDFGFTPKITVEEGIPLFVDWFKSYNRL